MLVPTNRLTLIDALRPPAGFRLESAMAVTFTLNLQALLAAPTAFAIAGLSDPTGDSGGHTPVELIHALRTHAHKLTVFSEAGEIGLPPASRAFAFLERAVVPVKAPRGGIVHPKVWVLRYESGDPVDSHQEKRLRVLISSRNLTFDESWDTVLRLDETAHPRGVVLAKVGELFEGLLKNTVRDNKEEPKGWNVEHENRVHSLARALKTARFKLPAGVDDLRIHILGLNQVPSPLPDTAERSLIISPFLADGFFSGVHPTPVDTLVSRQESFDALQPGIRDSIGNKYVFDDGGTLEDTEPKGPGRPLAGLHAKVFAFETRDRARLFVGSANATGPAFANNVEILAELRGPVAELGIDRLCNGDGDDPGLVDLFHTYHPSPERPSSNGTGCSTLDTTRRKIAAIPITGTVTAGGKECQEYAVTYGAEKPLPAVEGVEIHCWPLTTPGHRREVPTSESFEARFETSLEAISGFLAFELSHDCGEQSWFAVPVPLDAVPEHRDRCLLKALIGNAERFLRYLLALLYEDSPQFDLREFTRVVDSPASRANGPISFAVLEQLLRTMRRDPLKLSGLHPLIADLRADDALPPGFAELWDAIHHVAAEGIRSQDAPAP